MNWQARFKRAAAATTVATVMGGSLAWVSAQQGRSTASTSVVAIDPDDIGGVVTSAKGPEAGVWVIAETTQLPTKFAKIVVTDDQGRYVVPDLPAANYQVFVRGYGLVDSTRVPAKPGQRLNLSAVVAPDAKAAAQVYPANYWLSLAEIPKGTNTEQQVLSAVKECMTCHQVGDLATRTFPKNIGTFPTSLQLWDHRMRLGVEGPRMSAMYNRVGEQRKMFADWTDKIAAGAYPKEAPPRPKGVERNLVVTIWDWATETGGRSDASATDERNPRVNANGLVWGAVQSDDILAWLDPVTNTAGNIKIPSNAPKTGAQVEPSPYWGATDVWQRSADPRSVEVDHLGRPWLAVRHRAAQSQPAFCKAGSTNKFAKIMPFNQSGRQVAMYDPKTKEFMFVDTCFTADHNQFLPDADNTLVYGTQNSVSWIKTSVYEKTRDAEASQGWCPAILDNNGDGKITEWTEPAQPIDPLKDRRVQFSCYQVTAAPDGTLWCSASGAVAPRDDKVVRIDRGPNPPETCKAEVYQPPPSNPPVWGSGGSHFDSEGVYWTDWRGSDHITSFDRRKCKVLNGPTATGQHCAEGWKVYRKAGPTYQGLAVPNNADLLYLTQVDRHNTLGLGEDAVITGNVNSDELLINMPKTAEFVELRIPYPLGFFSRSTSGRIDNPNTGWKGKGLWSDYSTFTPWHVEGGQGTKQPLAKFQVRPSPLAK